MKNLLKIIFVLFVVTTIFSCTQEETNLDKNLSKQENIDFKTTEWNFDLNIPFIENLKIGYSNPKEINILLSEVVSEVFFEKSKQDEELFGVDIVISKNNTTIEPITKFKFSLQKLPTNCPSGFSDLGICRSEECVSEKIGEFFSANSAALASGATISIRLTNVILGKRVCGKVSLDNQQ